MPHKRPAPHTQRMLRTAAGPTPLHDEVAAAPLWPTSVLSPVARANPTSVFLKGLCLSSAWLLWSQFQSISGTPGQAQAQAQAMGGHGLVGAPRAVGGFVRGHALVTRPQVHHAAALACPGPLPHAACPACGIHGCSGSGRRAVPRSADVAAAWPRWHPRPSCAPAGGDAAASSRSTLLLLLALACCCCLAASSYTSWSVKHATTAALRSMANASLLVCCKPAAGPVTHGMEGMGGGRQAASRTSPEGRYVCIEYAGGPERRQAHWACNTRLLMQQGLPREWIG